MREREDDFDDEMMLIAWPTTLAEAARRLLEAMPEDDRRMFAAAGEEDLIAMHHTVGQWVRNFFGLWLGNDALLRDCGESHADDASTVIMRAARDLARKEFGP